PSAAINSAVPKNAPKLIARIGNAKTNVGRHQRGSIGAQVKVVRQSCCCGRLSVGLRSLSTTATGYHKSPRASCRRLDYHSRMFTGLVEELATVDKVVADANKRVTALRLLIRSSLVAKGVKIGDSIAVNGCCLTVVKKTGGVLAFDAGSETLSKTNLGRLKA